MNSASEKVQDIARGARVLEERSRLGLTQPKMAELGGVSKGSQILYEKGSAPSADYLTAIGQAGADVLYILTGERPPSPAPSRQATFQLPIMEPFIHFAEGSEASDIGRAEALRGSYLPVPWHPAARGNVSVPLALSREWIANTGIKLESLAAVQADEPTPWLPGSAPLALVDTSFPHEGGPWFWVIVDEGRHRVVRLQFDGDQAVILPGRQDERARIVDAIDPLGRAFLGRVVWLGMLAQ